MSVLYHSCKANVVVGALTKLYMSSVTHVEEENKELAEEVHRLACLGVCLIDTIDGGVIGQNGSKSSFVVEVKEKQDSDPILLQLKGAVHQHKVEVFSSGGDGATDGGHPRPVGGTIHRRRALSVGHPEFPENSRPTAGSTDHRLDYGPWFRYHLSALRNQTTDLQDILSVRPRCVRQDADELSERGSPETQQCETQQEDDVLISQRQNRTFVRPTHFRDTNFEELNKNIYMEQPPGYVSNSHPDYVYILIKLLYGHKQAPRAWNNNDGVARLQGELALRFDIKKSGELHHFLGLEDWYTETLGGGTSHSAISQKLLAITRLAFLQFFNLFCSFLQVNVIALFLNPCT
ncbi:hypothetical protein MTR67_026463 [Solanum verrucosum]|uniref:Reverse transcriptase Ty1/copia-type domain-containing protein n=1 Tax=Solanum verrucosum TaxID=315347 RepID=A0AAF0R2W2_SOLVR|nr:hypothetical protein MTR67_026463 [Solanum verrucosum]